MYDQEAVKAKKLNDEPATMTDITVDLLSTYYVPEALLQVFHIL